MNPIEGNANPAEQQQLQANVAAQQQQQANPAPQQQQQQAMEVDNDTVQLRLAASEAEVTKLRAEAAARDLADLHTADGVLTFDQRLKVYPKPDKFNSSGKQLSVADWISLAAENMEQVGYSESDRGRILFSWLSDKDKKRFKDSVSQTDGFNYDLDSVRDTLISIWGEADPDTAWLNKLIACFQNKRPAGDYITEFQDVITHISPEGKPTEHNQIFFFTRGLDDVFKERMGVNPVTQKPWASLSAVQQAARNHSALVKYGATGSATAQKRKSEGPASSSAPQAKRASSSFRGRFSKPGTRTEAEQAFLRKENLCFHCVSKEPDAHRSKDCPHKGKPPGQMPKNWNQAAGSKDFA